MGFPKKLSENQCARRSDADALTASVLINLMSLCVPIGMMQVFNRVIPNNSQETLLGILAILLGYIVVDAALKIARARIFMTNAIAAEISLVRSVVARLFRLPLPELHRMGHERLTERILGVRRLGRLRSSQQAATRIDLAFTLVFLGVIALVSSWLVCVALGLIAVASIWAVVNRRRFNREIQSRERNNAQRLSFLVEVLGNSRKVKLLQIEQVLLRRYEMLQNSVSKANESLVRMNTTAGSLSSVLVQIATGVTSVVGAYLVIREQITLADLAASILLTGRAVQPVLTTFFTDLDMAALSHAEQELETSLISARAVGMSRGPDASEGAATVRFSQLCVNEAETGAPVVSNLTHEIDAGSVTVLQCQGDIAADACLRVIAGLAKPDGGKITRLSPEGEPGSRSIYLGTGVDLMEGPLIKNLTAFRGRAQEDMAIKAGRLLGLDRNIQIVPGGYEHVFMSARQGHGSPGFVRKLAVARSFGSTAGLLILNRPFLHLDPKAQEGLVKLIEMRRGATTIILSDVPEHLSLDADCTITLRANLPCLIERARGAWKARQESDGRLRA